MLIPLLHVSYLLKNGYFPIFSLFWRTIFVTIATVLVESIPDFNTLSIVLITYLEETCEKQLLFFDFIGGPK